jgi:hypothetical protein
MILDFLVLRWFGNRIAFGPILWEAIMPGDYAEKETGDKTS